MDTAVRSLKSSNSAIVAEAGRDRPQRRIRGTDRPAGASTGARVGDLMTVVLAILSLAMTLRARADYTLWPLLGLLLPAIRWPFFASVRMRGRNATRTRWNEVRRFSAGSGPVPWLAVSVFVVLPVLLFYVTNGQILGAIDTRPVIPTAISL